MSRLNHTDKYFGAFKNSKGVLKAAYIKWKAGKGFVLYSEDDKVLIPTAYTNLAEMKRAGVNFQITGQPVALKSTVQQLEPAGI